MENVDNSFKDNSSRKKLLRVGENHTCVDALALPEVTQEEVVAWFYQSV